MAAFSAALSEGVGAIKGSGTMSAEEYQASGMQAPAPDIDTTGTSPSGNLAVDNTIVGPTSASQGPVRAAPARLEHVVVRGRIPQLAGPNLHIPGAAFLANQAYQARNNHNAAISAQALIAKQQRALYKFSNQLEGAVVCAALCPVAVITQPIGAAAGALFGTGFDHALGRPISVGSVGQHAIVGGAFGPVTGALTRAGGNSAGLTLLNETKGNFLTYGLTSGF